MVHELKRRLAAHGFVRAMLVEVAFEGIRRLQQLRDAVEVKTMDRLGFERAPDPFGQSVGPGVPGRGETVPNPRTAAGLRKDVNFGGRAPGPRSPPRELAPVVGEDAVHAEGIEALAVCQEGHPTGRIVRGVDLDRQQPGGAVDGEKQIAPAPIEAGQVEDIQVQEPRGTGPKAAARPPGLGPKAATRCNCKRTNSRYTAERLSWGKRL